MGKIKPIRSEADYNAALARIDALMDAESGTPEGDELDVLTDLVMQYEKKEDQQRARHIKALQDAGQLDPACTGCQPLLFWLQHTWPRGNPPAHTAHRASRYCESGKKAHCTCDWCF